MDVKFHGSKCAARQTFRLFRGVQEERVVRPFPAPAGITLPPRSSCPTATSMLPWAVGQGERVVRRKPERPPVEVSKNYAEPAKRMGGTVRRTNTQANKPDVHGPGRHEPRHDKPGTIGRRLLRGTDETEPQETMDGQAGSPSTARPLRPQLRRKCHGGYGPITPQVEQRR